MVKINTSSSVRLKKSYNFSYLAFISGIITAPARPRLQILQEVLNFATIIGRCKREA